MARSGDYRVTAEVFVIPHEGRLILYAPLKGVVAGINESTAALLQAIQREEDFELADEELRVLAGLGSVGVLNGPPDARLTVHEDAEFSPEHVTIFLTDACNLRCIYCYARGGSNPCPVKIPLDAAKAGIDLVAESAVRKGRKAFSVGFHGAGEPTAAWRELVELVRYTRRRADRAGLDASITTCTNGAMKPGQARWLAENADAATVSYDGLSRHQDRQRPRPNGEGSSAEVERTMRAFDDLGFFYGVRATITRESVHDMAEMVEFLDDNFGAGDLQFDPLIPGGRCQETGCEGASDGDYVAEYIRAYETARERKRMVGFSCLSFTALKAFYCCAAADGFTVTHEGHVTACFEACGLDRPFGKMFVYGRYDPDKGGFDLDMRKLGKLRKRHVYNMSFCRDCFCKYMCAGDCVMHALKMGYGFWQGARCEVTQAIGKHRLATVVRESTPEMVVCATEAADGCENDRPELLAQGCSR